MKRINLWRVYIVALFAGMVGMVATHSAVFPQLMFVATVIYIGARVSVQLEQARHSSNIPVATTALGRFLSLRFSLSLITLAAVVLMILSAYLFIPSTEPMANVGTATLLMLAGGLLLMLAIYLNSRQQFVEVPVFEFAAQESAFPSPYSLVTVIGILCLLLEAEISGQSLHLDWLQGVAYPVQGLLFWGGIALVAVGMSGNTGLQRLIRLGRQIRERDQEVLVLLAILVFAFVVRAWNLTNGLPESIDDGIGIPAVFPFLSGRVEAGLVTSMNEYQTTQVYAQLAAIGVRTVGFTLGGVRAINVVFGTLNILGIYLLANALFSKKMALVAALLLAAFPPHIHFSRLTYLHLVDAVVGTFTIAFLARGMKYNRRADWVLAGVFFGLTQYFFEAGRLFYPPLIAVWLGFIAVTNFSKFRKFGPGLALFLGTAIIIAMPTYYAAIARGSPIVARINESGAGVTYWQEIFRLPDPQLIILRVAAPFLAYFHLPETVLYYAGDHAMILEPLVPIFLLGLFYLLWMWRKPTVIVPMWILATSAANWLMLDSVENPRFIVGYPAIALTLAAGICYVLPLLLSALRSRAVVLGATALIVASACVFQVYFYYEIQLPRLVQQIRAQLPYPDIVDAAMRMTDMPPGTQAYFVSTVPTDLSVATTFLGLYRWQQPEPYLQVNDLLLEHMTPDFLKTLPHDKDYAFFVEPGHPEVVANLKSVFTLNEPDYTTQTDLPPDKAFVLYYAPMSKQTPTQAGS